MSLNASIIYVNIIEGNYVNCLLTTDAYCLWVLMNECMFVSAQCRFFNERELEER